MIHGCRIVTHAHKRVLTNTDRSSWDPTGKNSCKWEAFIPMFCFNLNTYTTLSDTKFLEITLLVDMFILLC